MKAAILISTLLIASCDSVQRTKNVCSCEEKAALQRFVQESIHPANNMSDEEMEDVIHQLTKDGIALFCHTEPIWLLHNQADVDWEKQKLDSCQFIMPY